MITSLYPKATATAGAEKTFTDRRGEALALTSADMGERYVIDDNATVDVVSSTEFGRTIELLPVADVDISSVGGATVSAADSLSLLAHQHALLTCVGTDSWSLSSSFAGAGVVDTGGGSTTPGTYPALSRTAGFDWYQRAISTQPLTVEDGGEFSLNVDVAQSRMIMGLCTAAQRADISSNVGTVPIDSGQLNVLIDTVNSSQATIRRFNLNQNNSGITQTAGQAIRLVVAAGGDTSFYVAGNFVGTVVNDTGLTGALYPFVILRNQGQSVSSVSATGPVSHTWDPTYTNLTEA